MSDSGPRPKRILVAPLDWGLGHATRCIPLIRELNEAGCEVILGADGAPLELLSKEFPFLEKILLPGYGIRYANGGAGFGMKMIAQLPVIRKAIRREARVLRQWLATHQLDAIISDNRFGLHIPGIPSVIMTHQLGIRSPFGPVSEKWLKWANYRYIQKFDACWVVDFPGDRNLAGKLSHPDVLPRIPLTYLGCLSRLQPGKKAITRDLTVVISGPEPQRSLFEQLITEQVLDTGLSVLIVRGQPGAPIRESTDSRIRIVPHLESERLNEALLESAFVLCRSGYSSVMDLVRLGKKAILVPTPGQTEQEYLGSYLMGRQYFLTAAQKNFRLKETLEQAAHFPYRPIDMPAMGNYRAVLRSFVQSLGATHPL